MKQGHKIGRPMRRAGEGTLDFIERMTVPEPNSGCLIWLGATSVEGYGSMRHDGRTQRVHRVVYTMKAGPIPPGMHVLHKCDMPSCVNPSHLFLGTNAENVADMVKKGRQPRLRGEKNGRAKLPAENVETIRALKGKVSQRLLARRFGISKSSIHDIQSGRRWRAHREGPSGRAAERAGFRIEAGE